MNQRFDDLNKFLQYIFQLAVITIPKSLSNCGQKKFSQLYSTVINSYMKVWQKYHPIVKSDILDSSNIFQNQKYKFVQIYGKHCRHISSTSTDSYRNSLSCNTPLIATHRRRICTEVKGRRCCQGERIYSIPCCASYFAPG